jgi:hypothetical protein
MSFKAIILLTRAESATHEDFAQWWLHQHAPLATQTVFPSCGSTLRVILRRRTQAKLESR